MGWSNARKLARNAAGARGMRHLSVGAVRSPPFGGVHGHLTAERTNLLWPSVIVGRWRSDLAMGRKAAARPDAILVDIARNIVMRGEISIRSRRRDLQVFLLLATRPIGSVCSVDSIIEQLWGDDKNGGPDNPAKAVSLSVSLIRKWGAMIGVSIETWWGRGYLITALASAHSRPSANSAAIAGEFSGQARAAKRRKPALAQECAAIANNYVECASPPAIAP